MAVPFPSRREVGRLMSAAPAVIATLRSAVVADLELSPPATWAAQVGGMVAENGAILLTPDADDSWSTHWWEFSHLGIHATGDSFEACLRQWMKCASRTCAREVAA